MSQPERRNLPDYLPARMVNEYVYCPRLFFYEWVDGVFRESADTVEGKALHARSDSGKGDLPDAAEASDAAIHARSVTLSSDRLRVIAKLDLVEMEGGRVTPVDYKHGKPVETAAGLDLWPADRAQLAVQALVLRDNGYACEEGLAYYWKTRQRVRVVFDEPVIAETTTAIAAAWAVAERGQIPPPLVDSPKCGGCSLAGICLPDETNLLRHERPASGQLALFPGFALEDGQDDGSEAGVRRLTPPRAERRPVYLNTQGLRVGRSGGVLQVREKDKLLQEIRTGEICQLNLMGNIQITTQAVHSLCEAEVPVCYFSLGGWFYGITTGLNTKNVFLRKAQFALAGSDWFQLKVARRIVAGKIRNQRTMLLRNHVEPPAAVLRGLKDTADEAGHARSLPELLGLEGYAARLYFQQFTGMIKAEASEGEFNFDFTTRNRRPPRDPVNALLSLAYSVLAKDLTVTCYAVGFDPLIGFYHQPRFGRAALALDLMEPFRPLIAESAVLSAINTRMVTPRDFIRAGKGVNLNANGRKGFFRAYEARMDSLVTHPLFDYRTSYRRLLEIQTRLLARVVEGEIGEYPVFVTR